jgi:hypothetical protein
MNKTKIVFMALLMSLFIQPAMAQASTNADLAYAFGTSTDTLQIDLLNAQDMEATKGEVFPFFAISVAARVVTSPVVRHYLSSAGIVASTYSWAKSMRNR